MFDVQKSDQPPKIFSSCLLNNLKKYMSAYCVKVLISTLDMNARYLNFSSLISVSLSFPFFFFFNFLLTLCFDQSICISKTWLVSGRHCTFL